MKYRTQKDIPTPCPISCVELFYPKE